MHKNSDAPDEMWDRLFSTTGVENSLILEEIVVHYQYLVEGIARNLEARLPTYVEDDDLLSLGQVGLLKAISKYDPSVGKFSKYASIIIHGSLIDGLRAYDFAPRGLRKQQRDLEHSRKTLRQELSREPTVSESAEFLGITEYAINEIDRKVIRAGVSPVDPILLPDYTEPDEYDVMLICSSFVTWLSSFPKTTQEVIYLKYWANMTNTAIGDKLGITAERVKKHLSDVLTEVIPFMEDLVTE